MRRIFIFSMMTFAGFLSGAVNVRADGPQLSPERLDMLERHGYFTPAFKQAVHDLVDAKKRVVDAQAEQKELLQEVPGMEKQCAEVDDKVKDLRQQFDDLNHIDESEFVELQKKMLDPSVKLEEQRVLAQAYVWGYPSSPHQAEAQKDLAEVQKKIADDAQAAADAQAAKIAAHAKLVERAKIKDLSVSEWRDLLLTMSKEDLLKFIGKPETGTEDDWTYVGGWTNDPVSQQKVGLHITFNGGRVINVTQASH